MAELKPCPFCGGVNVFIAELRTNFFESRYAAVCEDCQSLGGNCKTEEKAIEAWNRRNDDG